MKKAPLLLLFTLLLGLIPSLKAQEERVVLFHINDLHGKIDTLPQTAGIVSSERASGREVLFLNGGDNFTGNPLIDQAKPAGSPMISLFSKMGFTLQCVGNHDFDYGQKGLLRYAESLKFPLLGANMDLPPELAKVIVPSFSIRLKNGLELVFFGLIQREKESGIPSTMRENVEGVVFHSPAESLAKILPPRRAGRILILLSHVGYEEDKELADRFPQLDLIIGAHSHTRINTPSRTNGVLIAQAGSDGDFLGRIELVVDKSGLRSAGGSLIDLKSVKEEDRELRRLVQEVERNPEFTKTVVQLPFSLSGKDALGSLMTDSLRRVLSLDAVFHNNGGIRLNRLDRKITLKDLYTLYPFQNQMVIGSFSVGGIKEMLRESYSRRPQPDLQVSGLRYGLVRFPDGTLKDIVVLDQEGRPLPDSHRLRVGINSYVASLLLTENREFRSAKTLPEGIVSLMVRFFQENPGWDYRVYRDPRRIWEEVLDGPVQEKVLAKLSLTLGEGNPFEGSTPTGNLMADGLKSIAKTDFALFPSKQIRSDLRVRANAPVTPSLLLRLYGYIDKNKPVTATILGSDLIELFRRESLYNDGFPFQLSGFTCRVLLKRGKAAVEIADISPDRPYTIVTDGYEASKNPVLKKMLKGITELNITEAQALEQYLHRGTPSRLDEKRGTLVRQERR